MSDQEHVVCVIDRGEHGAIRIARKTFNGGPPFTDIRFFYKEGGELKPTGKGTSIRDSELHVVLDALTKIARKIEGQRAPSAQARAARAAQARAARAAQAGAARAPQHRTISATTQAELELDQKLF